MVPLDGILLSDSGTFDESSLTGESLPVERVAGDALMSGSLNGEAAVRMQVSALMEDSQYSRIVALVKEASDSKAPMVRLADRYAVPFTALAYVLGARRLDHQRRSRPGSPRCWWWPPPARC